ncbi:MAG: hypothetical protein QGI68_00575 [Pseudomonadales bacterium]|jgi:hypothetical protein|nr:hypothetical protein [Pseudomonadales bacterium]MDP7357680.1 hypothetical protein [Pseudomonadales bacterium]MDP7594053.1 hypothetical protein [Pseudomonadales bacterium]HJN49890.1 hypothetical protein [Pseudomonadales bacterium]|tara:strand:+ start:976 stop:1845 length:870 start_codon:yes stop_codon:yes gene_type:complete
MRINVAPLLMKRSFRVIIIALGIFGIPQGIAEQSEKTELIQELISSSGLENRILGLPPLINRMMVSGILDAGDPNEVSEPLRHIVTTTFRASSIKGWLARELAKNLTMQELNNTATFFDSHLGRTIVQLEIDASLKGTYTERTSTSQQLQQANRKDPTRARLFEKLDAATYGSVIAVNLAENLRMGVGNSLLSASLLFDEGSRDGLKERVDAAHFRLRGRITQEIFITYLFLFGQMKDEELATYLQFATSNAGKKYFLSVKEGIDLALTNAFQTTDKLLAEKVKSGSSS